MAWIEERQRKKGIVYKTYWRDVSGITRTKTFSVKKDAERFARHVEVAKDLGTYVDPGLGRVTLATFYEHFIHTAQNLRPSTRAKYEVHARAYILPAFGARRLNSVTPADVGRLLPTSGIKGRVQPPLRLASACSTDYSKWLSKKSGQAAIPVRA